MLRVWSSNLRTRHRREQGFSPVEVLLAATVFGFLTVGLVGAIVYGRQSTAQAGDRSRAIMLAEEGTEAARSIRDANFANLVNGTHGLSLVGNQWMLSGGSDTVGKFTRRVTITAPSVNRKVITSAVTWNEPGGGEQVSVSTQLTNWMATLNVPKSWNTPALSGGVDVSGGNDGVKVATQGNFAYIVIASGNPDFVVVNIANPSAPAIVGALNLSGNPTNIAVSGSYAYVTGDSNNEEMQVVNIANPSSPSKVGGYNATGNADGLGVFVVGDRAYITRAANSGSDELVVLDVGNPAAPSRVGGYSSNISMNEVYVNGTDVYIATDSNAQEVVRLSTQFIWFFGYIYFVASENLPGNDDALTIAGTGSSLVVGQGNSVYTLNSTTLLDSISTPGTVYDVELHANGQLAFAGTNAPNELQVINIANLGDTSIAGSVGIAGSNVLSGVAYNATVNAVAGASSSNSQEGVVFVPN